MGSLLQRAAVVGAGPAGFYTADALLNAGFSVDLFDRLATPYGLVRSGVAPDHPKIKSVTRAFARTAEHEAFRFFGDVTLGEDVTRQDLRDHYQAVVYALGTPDGAALGISGEDLPGSFAATDFVGWYNGHPDFAQTTFPLGARRAVVIGNGNVALDVARMLTAGHDVLETTDCADHALTALAASSVEEVMVVGRRGPAQAAFGDPEVKELGGIADVDAAELELDALSAAWRDTTASPIQRRVYDTLRGFPTSPAAGCRRVALRFLWSPIAILGTDRVEGIMLERNQIEAAADGTLRAIGTGVCETMACGMVIRCVGFRGRPVPGLPFDERRGLLPHAAGRLLGDDGRPSRGEYVAGWAKRGPSGVIGTNKRCAAETVTAVLEDRDAGCLNVPMSTEDARSRWLESLTAHAVDWTGWTAIDTAEQATGERDGRPRVKLVQRDDLRRAAAPPFATG